MRRAVRLTLVLIAAASPATAFDFVVTRYDDPAPDGCLADDCSLREATIAANTATDPDRILLSAGTYLLTIPGTLENNSVDGDLDLTQSAELVGVGAGISVIDGGTSGENVIRLSKTGGTFALRSLSVRNGALGGASLGAGTHTVEDCDFSDNGPGNHAGLTAAGGSVATVRRSTFTGNSGAGMFAVQGSMAVENSTFSGNSGIELLANLTVSLSCTHCTIFDPEDGDSFELDLNDSPATFVNSLVAGDCSFSGTGALDSLGGNLESPGNGCTFDQGTDQHDVTAVALDLGSLSDNGGQTRTHLPGAGSPAIGNVSGFACLSSDQRGVARPVSAHTDCDAGAVERIASPVATAIFYDGFLQGDPEAWSDAVGEEP